MWLFVQLEEDRIDETKPILAADSKFTGTSKVACKVKIFSGNSLNATAYFCHCCTSKLK